MLLEKHLHCWSVADGSTLPLWPSLWFFCLPSFHPSLLASTGCSLALSWDQSCVDQSLLVGKMYQKPFPQEVPKGVMS